MKGVPVAGWRTQRRGRCRARWQSACAAAALAAASLTATDATAAADTFGFGAAVPPVPVALEPSGRLQRVALAGEGGGEGEGDPGTRTRRGRYALPMLLSAIVPGTGEIVTGHLWNGLPLVAADVATWLGYAHYQSEGDTWKDTYEAFADAHWDEGRWQQGLAHADSMPPNPWDSYWDPSAPYNCDCSPPYIPRSEDEREYYENLGKYNHFFPGWEDWTLAYDPESPASLRRQYVDMRIESNDNYENADTMLGVAAATRLLSIIQTYWLVRRDGRSDGLFVEPVTFRGRGSGMRLKWSF
jgi:hypothetical protein